MSDGEDCDGVIINAIAGDIAAVAKIDDPFAEVFREIIDHPPKAGMCRKYLQAQPDRLTCPSCSTGILRAQKIP